MAGTTGSISYVPVAAAQDKDFSPQVLCDTLAGVTTTFLRSYTVDESTGVVTKVDTLLDGTTAYAVTGVVGRCSDKDIDALLSTGARALAASSTFDVKAGFPGLQSVTLIVRTGTTNVTMTDGTNIPMLAGESATWSVSDTDDSSLQTASFTTAAASTALVLYTYKGTAAG